MPIARRLEDFLEASGLPYEIRAHAPTSNSTQTARSAHVPLGRLAKPVLLGDEYGYVLALVTADSRIDLARLGAALHRELELACEAEIDDLFEDCAPGALPALGQPWEIPTVYDDALRTLPDVWFEAGDHREIVHMRGPDYLALLGGALHGSFSAALGSEPDR